MLKTAKYGLTLLGKNLPSPAIRHLQAACNYIAIGRWMLDHGFQFPKRVTRREEVWLEILKFVREKRVLYLEFGVYKGTVTRFWARELQHPEAILHGFDSFKGLPAAGGPWKRQQFDLLGNVPLIEDPRVKFFKGWFDQTLPDYKPPAHDALVIIMDADLHSSTSCVLRHLRAMIRPGTFIYFDEMNQIEHEPKAFAEFIEESGLKFRGFCADRTLAFVAFQCLA